MADDGYTVAENELRTFAKDLNSTADTLTACAGAVRGVSYGITTWGIVGEMFAVKNVRDATNSAGDDLEACSSSLRDTSKGVDNTIQTYLNVEEDIAGRFGGDK
ncbi:hypothetical protein [Actinophytocola gossypii]|uniref:Excreted virulence factor EspC, type VII ESX diderm n=1 Tax=Actinophytocola gossypii TaxID=2812003 RepID=A0ABT2JCE1_9PSEU|nr:hypothetical protein [Actinophytocola gossypii]MCT2585515.1 hypothetical protein [Actinophytocola gossypii]